MKKIMLIAAAGLFSLLFYSCADKAQAAEKDIHFYYLELCPGCEEYEIADSLAGEVTRLGGKALNLLGDDEARKMGELLEKKGLTDIAHVLPLLIVEDEYFVGYDDIYDKIKELSK